MSTSGTVTFSRNRDQLIKAALQKVNAFESGETPDSESVSDASAALNAMIKDWQGNGIQIYKTVEATLFSQTGQAQYSLGLTSTDHATETWTQTTLAVAAAASASTISVASATGIATTYKIGIELDSGSFFWTTVNGAPAGVVVTLTAVLTGAAALGNRVITYQTNLVRPLKILSARRYNFDSTLETPTKEMSRIEYQEYPNKASTGSVNGYFYDRRENTLGYLYLWPTPATIEDAIKMTVAKPIEDFTAAGNDADLPQEWIRAIVWGLADEIADDYDVPEPKRTRLERRAAQYLADADWWERELLDIQFVPDRR